MRTTETAQTGVIYATTGNSQRGTVHSYHYKPSPLFLNKSKHRTDIAGLKSIEQRTAVKFNGHEYESKFTIGFEIEKNQLHRGAVKEYELFCGFERDSSCGYEAVTHILPLLPNGKWKTKVFDMVLKAEKIIDDRYSPSDRRCGGHITIACDGLTGEQVRQAVRKNAGIILALFRKRLNNAYCGSNRRMQGRDEYVNYNSTSSYSYSNDGWHNKYQTALVKGNCLEFRVPSKFESVKQTMRRYELFYELVNFSVNNPNGNFKTFLKKIKPIIVSMYNGDESKADEVLEFAIDFQVFINKGTISDKIQGFL
jgi:hypothetical protein